MKAIGPAWVRSGVRNFPSLAFSALFIAQAATRGAQLTWFPGPPLDWPVSDAATVAVPRIGNVLLGGDFSYYPVGLAATNSYWRPLPAMAATPMGAGAVANGGFIIVYGGSDGTTSTDAVNGYSTSGDTLQTFASMSVARSYFGYVGDNQARPYAIGGLDATGQPLSSAERYDPDTDSWAPLAGLPEGRNAFPAVFDGKSSIYIFGGHTASAEQTASVMRYSISQNNWTAVAALPVAVASSTAAMAPDGKIYVIGGSIDGVSVDLAQVYDPTSNLWVISTALPEALAGAAMGVDGLGRLIVMGGRDAPGADVSDVWRSQQLGVPDTAPIVTAYPGTNAIYLSSYNSFISATGNPQPVYVLVNGPTNMSVDYFTGAIAWTPEGLAQIGPIPVTIRATNAAGFIDDNFVINVPNPPPSLPAHVHIVDVTEYTATLAWDSEDPIAGAIVFSVFIPHPWHDPRGSGGGVNYEFVGSTTSTSVTLSGLKPNTSYSFDVNASGPGGISGYSGISVRTTGPQPPSNLRVTGITSTSVSLEWDPSVGPVPVARYEVLGWVGGLFPTTSYGSNYTATSATVTGLTPPNYEEWTVRAYDMDGNASGFSPGVFANNPLPTPAHLSATSLSQGGLQLTVTETGASLQTVFIEATTTPTVPASWVQIGSALPGATAFSFVDTNAVLYPARFYRVISP